MNNHDREYKKDEGYDGPVRAEKHIYKHEIDKGDFKRVVYSVLRRLLSIDLAGTGIQRVYLDLNSAISILFRVESIDSDDVLVDILKEAIEGFMSTNLKTGMTCYILYSMQPSLVHTTIEPNWCKLRDERVTLTKSEFVKKLLVALKVYSGNHDNIKVINCGQRHPAIEVFMQERGFSGSSLVLSRDPVFNCFIKKTIRTFNGLKWIDFNSDEFSLPNDIQLLDRAVSLPWYFILRGDSRNEYTGYSGYGSIKSIKYIDANRIKIKTANEHPLMEFISPRLPLYSIKEMMNKAKELKLV